MRAGTNNNLASTACWGGGGVVVRDALEFENVTLLAHCPQQTIFEYQ